MVDDPTKPHYPDRAPEDETIESTRMSFGDHLEELRTALVRALLGVGAVAVVTLIYGREILEIIFRPLWMVQFNNGLQPNLQALAPTDAFTAYLKVSALSALIIAMPWVLRQGWKFISIGLYHREQKFVRGIVWASSGLFIVGVLFLYYLVLPVVLQFFITFNRAFGPADLTPFAVQSLLISHSPPPPETPSNVSPEQLPLRSADPTNPRPGEIWVNSTTRRLMLKTGENPADIWSIPFEPGAISPAMQSQFAVDQYISFVLLLALAFGFTFETPIVVVFLSWSGLVATATMSKSRRYVFLGTIVVSAILTPTADILNQSLLAGPMYVLFELGLFVAKRIERNQPATA